MMYPKVFLSLTLFTLGMHAMAPQPLDITSIEQSVIRAALVLSRKPEDKQAQRAAAVTIMKYAGTLIEAQRATLSGDDTTVINVFYLRDRARETLLSGPFLAARGFDRAEHLKGVLVATVSRLEQAPDEHPLVRQMHAMVINDVCKRLQDLQIETVSGILVRVAQAHAIFLLCAPQACT